METIRLFACNVDLEKAYDRVPRDELWKVLHEYSVDGQLLRAITSFYCQPEVCVRVKGKQSKPFHVGIGLRQGCVLSPLVFIVYTSGSQPVVREGFFLYFIYPVLCLIK